MSQRIHTSDQGRRLQMYWTKKWIDGEQMPGCEFAHAWDESVHFAHARRNVFTWSAITKRYLNNFDPQIPLLYRKTGLQGYTLFLYFCSKHRLWVRVRTASPRRFKRVSAIYVLSRNTKKYQICFLSENFQFCRWNFDYICIGVFS